MHIEHIAVWKGDIERLRAFYERYFGAVSGARYVNPAKGFQSCFLAFTSGARLQIMQMPGIPRPRNDVRTPCTGYIHLALATGSHEGVDTLTAQLRAEGHPVLDGPRATGDGYYESTVLDPDGNRIEVTI